MSRKQRHFQGTTREIRNFSENNYYFQITIFVSNNFASEGRLDSMSVGGSFRMTNRTLPQDGCGPEVGVSHRIYVYWFCLFPIMGPKLNTYFYFLKPFGHPRDIPAKSRDIPPKSFVSLSFEGHTELFGPHPFTWELTGGKAYHKTPPQNGFGPPPPPMICSPPPLSMPCHFPYRKQAKTKVLEGALYSTLPKIARCVLPPTHLLFSNCKSTIHVLPLLDFSVIIKQNA